jgi:transketolase
MGNLSHREAYGRAIVEYGEVNPKVVVVDVDTSASTMSRLFSEKFPDRFFNVGIAEPCMVDVGAGLALGGKIPFLTGFAALLSLRAIEQVRTCICYANLNVKLVAPYAGLSDYKDGATHHSILDISIMRCLPNMTVIVPADDTEITKWVPVIAEHEGPVYLRLSRASTISVHSDEVKVSIGKGMTMKDGSDVTLIAAGSLVGRCMLAAEKLEKRGVSTRVLNVPCIKPLDNALILQAAEETGGLVTAEENTILGGLGGAVAELLSEYHPTPIKRVGINDTFALTAPDPDMLLDAFGMSVGDLVTSAEEVLSRKYWAIGVNLENRSYQ